MSSGDMTDAGIDDMRGLVRPAEEEAVNLGWERGWGREHEVIVSCGGGVCACAHH